MSSFACAFRPPIVPSASPPASRSVRVARSQPLAAPALTCRPSRAAAGLATITRFRPYAPAAGLLAGSGMYLARAAGADRVVMACTLVELMGMPESALGDAMRNRCLQHCCCGSP